MQKLKNISIYYLSNKTHKMYALGMLLLMFSFSARAQTTAADLSNYGQTINYSGEAVDYLVPANKEGYFIYFHARGGGGGKATDEDDKNGGEGAFVTAGFKIGNGDNEIPEGSLLRFIIGGKGQDSGSKGAGGGGGTAIVLQPPNSTDWDILMVAGGGGGGGGGYEGDPGCSGTAGGDGCNDGSEKGEDGQGSSYGNGGAGNGGGAYSSGSTYEGSSYHIRDRDGKAGMTTGEPSGGSGGKGSNSAYGGFGFGGGGSGKKGGGIFEQWMMGGGGGGYSGGGSGGSGGVKGGGAGGGGGSFLSSKYKKYDQKISRNGHTSNAKNGCVNYQLINPPPVQSIRLAKDVNKSIDLTDGKTYNGTNIRLWNFIAIKRQQWSFVNERIKLSKDLNKCLDISTSNTSIGTNIQLWDCNDSDGQYWIYDGINRSIRLKKNLTKCIDLSAGITSDGSNIQLWDCVGNDNQKWKPTGLAYPAPENPESKQTIRLANDQDKCIDLSSGNTSNGANIQLWNCGSTNTNQQWIFINNQIKLNQDQRKCLGLPPGIFTAGNGMNIQLWDCNDTDAQKWIYDGITNVIRLKKHPNYCIDLSHGNTSNGSNIQLWKCGPTNTNQKWIIKGLK